VSQRRGGGRQAIGASDASRGDERRAGLEAAFDGVLRASGLDPALHPDLGQTAARVARLWQSEFLAGYAMDPATILGDPVVGEADPDVVVVGGLRFHAMCPHHLLPYRGVAHVAYLPNGKLVGFGRLAELVDCFTKRLTLQERATHQIAEALCANLGARGAGCVIEAEQLCLALPGEKHDASGVVTSAFVGEMRERPDLKARLLEAANLGGRGR
jgi:GTP cyclohydrolase IA